MRYLVSGYYGEANLGDEAILAAMLRDLQLHDPAAEISVLSFDPADTAGRHGVEALSTSLRHPSRLVEAIRRSHLVISGGGSLLHEADFALHGRSFLWREGRLRPVPYFLSVVTLARLLGRPVMFYAQGLGPLHTAEARQAVGRVGSLCQVVTWRDVDSARLAAEVGVRAPVQLVVPDPAYSLAPASVEMVAATLRDRGLPAGIRYLAVCPRPWLGRTTYQQHLGTAIARVAAALDLAVVFVPFQERIDGPLCAELRARPDLADRAWVVSGADDPAVVAGILGGAELAVTMRLHSGILAAAAGTPAAAIDYDPKVRAFLRQTGQEPWAVTADELESAHGQVALEGALFATARDLPRRRVALARKVRPLQAEAGRTAALAVQLAAWGGLPGGPRR
jgi:polysaccharide pyruvyl transferase CsaB